MTSTPGGDDEPRVPPPPPEPVGSEGSLPAELDEQAARLDDAAGERLRDDLSSLVGTVFGFGLHLVVGWFHLAAGLVVPPWALALLLLEWVVLAVVLWRVRRRPLVALAIPFVSALVWILVVAAGGQFLGWTATGDGHGDGLAAGGDPGPVETAVATAPPTAPSDEPITYATTACDGAPADLVLLCQVVDLVRERHVEPPDDAQLAAAAVEGVRRGDGVPDLVCPLPSEAFRPLCDAFARSDRVDAEAVQASIEAMLTGALDPYSGYQDPVAQRLAADERDGEVEGIGALVTSTNTATDDPEERSCTRLSDTCRVLFVSILPDTPAERAGLQEGDLLVSVDGEDVAGSTLNDVVETVRGPKGTPVTLTVERDGELITVSPVRDAIELTVITSEVLDDGVGYIRLLIFTNNADELFRDELRRLLDAGIDTLVLDLRDNPGGSLDSAVSIASEFLDGGLVLQTEAPDQTRPYPVEGGGIATGDAPELIVLVDRGSASASEVVSGAWQDRGRATLVGERTFGKNTVQQTFDLDDGGALKLTIARWVTPAGRDFGEVGIAPDVEVDLPSELTVEEAVERALAAVRG